jgi:hypothetical protein
MPKSIWYVVSHAYKYARHIHFREPLFFSAGMKQRRYTHLKLSRKELPVGCTGPLLANAAKVRVGLPANVRRSLLGATLWCIGIAGAPACAEFDGDAVRFATRHCAGLDELVRAEGTNTVGIFARMGSFRPLDAVAAALRCALTIVDETGAVVRSSQVPPECQWAVTLCHRRAGLRYRSAETRLVYEAVVATPRVHPRLAQPWVAPMMPVMDDGWPQFYDGHGMARFLGLSAKIEWWRSAEPLPPAHVEPVHTLAPALIDGTPTELAERDAKLAMLRCTCATGKSLMALALKHEKPQ